MLNNNYPLNSLEKSSQKPLVSIVIPTRDNNLESNLYLQLTLEGISMQTYPHIETLVIADGERSHNLNLGISKSTGKYILRLDDDWFMSPNTISDSVNLLERNPNTFLVINNIFPHSKSILENVRRIERELIIKYDYWNHIAGNFFPSSFNPKFDESLYMGEEFELHKSLVNQGHSFLIYDNPFLHLREPSNFKRVVTENLYYGKNSKQFFISPTISKLDKLFLIMPIRLVHIKHIRQFGLYFYPFLIYQYIRFTSGLIGLLIKRLFK